MSFSAPPLPRSLQHRPFHVREALAAGLSRRQLERSDLRRPYHGVRSPNTSETPHAYPRAIASQRAQEFLPLLRTGELFSHTTALMLIGAPIQADPRPHVTIRVPSAAAHRANVHGHRTRRNLQTFVSSAGLPCVSPLVALTQVAMTLQPRELVVAIDHLVRRNARGTAVAPFLTLEDIWEVARSGGFWGAQRLRTAAGLSRIGAESRMESLTRLLLLESGYPQVELQSEVFDTRVEHIGRFDLRIRGTRKLIEYDGDQHRTDQEQYARDQTRIRRANLAGYEVLRLTAADLHPSSRQATRQLFREFVGAPPARLPRRVADFLSTTATDSGRVRAATKIVSAEHSTA